MGKLAKDSVASAIFIVMGFFIGAVANMFIYPKICTKEELGQFKLLLNWAIIASQFIALGAGPVAVKYVPHFRASNRLGELNYMILLFPVIGLVTFLIIYLPFSG